MATPKSYESLRQAIVMILLLGIYCSSNLHAQSVFNRYLTEREGLLSNTVYCVSQDAKGYLWMGTDRGVSRYNGHSYKNFTLSDGLSDNDVLQIKEDSQGRIWMLTYNGNPCFYDKGLFHNAENTSFLRQCQLNGFIRDLEEGADGSIYLSSSLGDLFVISPQNTVQQLQGSKDKPTSHQGLWWYKNQLFGVDRKKVITNYTKALKKEILPELGEGPCYGNLRSFFQDGQLYLVSGSQLFVLNDNWETERIFTLEEKEWINYVGPAYHSNQILLGTRDGMRTLDLGTWKLSAKMLTGKSATYACRDGEGAWWVSTQHDGVCFAQSNQAVHFDASQIPQTPVYALHYFDDTLWMGTAQRSYGAIVDKELVHFQQQKTDPIVPNNSRILNLYTVDSSLYFQIEKMIFPKEEMIPKDKLYRHHSLNTICQDKAGQFWAGGLRGITPINGGDRTIRKSKPNQIYISTKAVITLSHFAADTFWYGTTNGVHQVSISDGRSQPIFQETRKTRVVAIQQLPRNRVLVATYGWGLFIYEDQTLIGHLSAKEGNYPSYINHVRTGAEDNLWLACDDGVYQIQQLAVPVAEWQWRKLDYSNGLLSNLAYDVCLVKDEIYIANSLGISILDTVLLSEKKAPPRLYFESLSTPDTTYFLPQNTIPRINRKHTLTLKWEAISYFTSSLDYRYRLDDGAWINTKADELSFEQLGPGQHHFELAVRHGLSPWSTEEQVFFTIAPLWWQMTWFKIALCGLLVFLIYSLVHLKILLIDQKRLLYYLRHWLDKTRQKEYLKLKTSTGTVRLAIDDILWIKADANYCTVMGKDQKVMFLATLKSLEERLQKQTQFLRVHRSYLINLKEVCAANGNQVTIAGQDIPVGVTYRKSYKVFYDSFKA